MQDGIDHDLRSHPRTHRSQMHDARGHGLEDWLRLDYILWDTADQKGDLPRRHAGDAAGNGRIDKADLTRLTHGVQLLRHCVGDRAGLDDEVWMRRALQDLSHCPL